MTTARNVEQEQDIVEAWKIGLFTEKVNEVLTEQGKKNVHRNTLDNWFKRLEKLKIHYLPRSGKEKVYLDLDLQIALFISQKKDAGWELDGIFNVISNQFETRPEQKENKDDSKEEGNQDLSKELKKELLDVFTQIEELKNQIHLNQESNETKRLNRLNDNLTSNKIRKILRNEATVEWNNLPIEDRTITQEKWMGLIKIQIEDHNKMYNFINEYIEDNYERKLREEFDLQEETSNKKLLN